jgi:hypothetical protein
LANRQARGTSIADLVSDIVGRVNRLPLKPSETNALLPLMEAFGNALHVVNIGLGDDTASKRRIQITILRNSNEVIGFKVEDNGIGFTDENYRSFRTPDRRQKIGLGGKGSGVCRGCASSAAGRSKAFTPMAANFCGGRLISCSTCTRPTAPKQTRISSPSGIQTS